MQLCEVLVVQYDPVHCSMSILNHAKHICAETRSAWIRAEHMRSFQLDGSVSTRHANTKP